MIPLLLIALTVQQPSPNPRTDWFHEAGYGVFVHYLSGLQNSPAQFHSLGHETPWNECVAEFDTEAFAATMHEVGAGYVIFTVMQRNRTMIAPNATFDRISGYKPGEACATRDLIDDLYQSLTRYKIPLMLYYTGDGPIDDPQARQAFGWTDPINDDFVERWSSVAREYGERYGKKVAGWWVDGSYPWLGYNDQRLAVFAEALRAGNPDRIVAFNRGVDPKVMSYTPHEDYTCGEQNRFFDMPPERFLDGEQWHILSYLGDRWGAPGCAYSKCDLGDYVFEVHRRGGVVSIDVILFRDGSLDRSQIELLKAVRHALDYGEASPSVPPGNLAYRKQSLLLSLDGSHPLQVNGDRHFPRFGVDGRHDTLALAGGEWPWTYEVDLVDTVPIHRIKVTFGAGYATHFELKASTDRQAWVTVAAKTGHDGTPFEATFEPVTARYLRVSALQPSGPDQPGTQMSIRELEVYAAEQPQDDRQ